MNEELLKACETAMQANVAVEKAELKAHSARLALEELLLDIKDGWRWVPLYSTRFERITGIGVRSDGLMLQMNLGGDIAVEQLKEPNYDYGPHSIPISVIEALVEANRRFR